MGRRKTGQYARLINYSYASSISADSYGEGRLAASRVAWWGLFRAVRAMPDLCDAITPDVMELCPLLRRLAGRGDGRYRAYLVSHPKHRKRAPLLLPLCGTNSKDFLHSLDDLPRDRARIGGISLHLPRDRILHRPTLRCPNSLICDSPVAGSRHLMMGILRRIGRDYGAFALL